MALRTVVTKENPILRKKSKIVADYDAKIAELIDDMWETMYKAEGVGLAAPQIGILKRIVVIDVTPLVEDEDGEMVPSDERGHDAITRFEMVNPVILESDGEELVSEGCLSVPGYTGKVIRPTYVKAEAYDRNGAKYIVEAEGLLAKAICHELDHLEGVLYIDKAESVDKC
jgi:peptide deformylase